MKYIKKQIEVDAVQWDGTLKGLDDLYIAYGEAFSKVASFKYMTKDESIALSINTLEGKMKVSKGDYVIRGIMGEFYACKPNIFQETYIKKEN